MNVNLIGVHKIAVVGAGGGGAGGNFSSGGGGSGLIAILKFQDNQPANIRKIELVTGLGGLGGNITNDGFDGTSTLLSVSEIDPPYTPFDIIVGGGTGGHIISVDGGDGGKIIKMNLPSNISLTSYSFGGGGGSQGRGGLGTYNGLISLTNTGENGNNIKGGDGGPKGIGINKICQGGSSSGGGAYGYFVPNYSPFEVQDGNSENPGHNGCSFGAGGAGCSGNSNGGNGCNGCVVFYQVEN